MAKKILALFLCLVMALSLVACSTATTNGTTAPETTSGVATPENATIRLATTTSVNDSGLLNYLLPHFEKKTGYTVEVASAGTGVAIGYAQSGDADLILVHSKDQEQAFIDAGYASTDRLSFMYNYFVICGPADDQAGVAKAENAAEAFEAIAAADKTFVSRGDNSGTYTKEVKIWGAAGITPGESDSWYVSVGSGMGDTLNKANELKGYVLTDKATYLSNKDSFPNITILKAESDDMKNTYSVIGVNASAKAFAGSDVKINTEGANALINWLLSDEAAGLIAAYGIDTYGEQLFFLIKD